MINVVAVHGFRSLREVALPLGPITVVTGPNGAGKSSLYRALRLLADAAAGRLVGSLARAGGLGSVLWAGPEHLSGAMKRGDVAVQGAAHRRKPVSLMLGFATDTLGYLVDVGLPIPRPTMFVRDPAIKREAVFAGPVLRPAATLVRRKGPVVAIRDGPGWRDILRGLDDRASVLDEVSDPDSYPDLAGVRAHLRSWRFYDSFRTDADAPARQPGVGTWTPALAPDGSDLPAAIQTILESGRSGAFVHAVGRALDGGRVSVADAGERLHLQFHQRGLLRPLAADELSDGTLRFLLLAAALTGPDPPRLLVVNEPETSLHPGVLPGLAELVVDAAQRTQVVVVSHARRLVEALASADDRVVHHELGKELGETVVVGQGLLSRPPWEWGHR